jgi:hypothetical protein
MLHTENKVVQLKHKPIVKQKEVPEVKLKIKDIIVKHMRRITEDTTISFKE